jgi:hypothetical protein
VADYGQPNKTWGQVMSMQHFPVNDVKVYQLNICDALEVKADSRGATTC